MDRREKMTAQKRKDREKLLENAVRKIFSLSEKIRQVYPVERHEKHPDVKLWPKAELLAVFEAVFEKVELSEIDKNSIYARSNKPISKDGVDYSKYFKPDMNALQAKFGPDIKNGLGEDLFNNPVQPLLKIRCYDLYDVFNLVEVLQEDLQSGKLLESQIVGRRIEDRAEALRFDPDNTILPLIYYKRVVGYSLKKIEHPVKDNRASSFDNALYSG